MDIAAAEHIVILNLKGGVQLTLYLSKIGGGTVGKSYTGHWEYAVDLEGYIATYGSDLYTGSAHTHEQAAHLLAEFLADDELFSDFEDELYLWATKDEPIGDEEEDEPPDTAITEEDEPIGPWYGLNLP